MTANAVTPIADEPAHLSMEPLLVWDEVVAMTRDMLGAAGNGEWDAVRELEIRRRSRLHALLDKPVAPDHAPEIADNIEGILQLDEQIMQLGRQQMGNLSQQLGQVRTGRQAVAAYRDQSGSAARE